ncbi:MAG: hypothetical protein LBR83_06860 [Clostridiales bacterium]|jgi:hypothetical protein|nr:hypothetical protein [Clostridiales bacterium]
MAKTTKKVIFFIAEGESDKDALYPILKKIFQTEEVHFHVVGGDITSEWLTNSKNAIKTIHEQIKHEMGLYKYRLTDIIKVIHLTDTDGAFIPDENVVAGDVKERVYEENQIIAKNFPEMIERNHRKSQVLQKLFLCKEINSLPYTVYYFSRNREHVLHNINAELSPDEKMDYADQFAETYKDHAEEFIHFLSNSDFTVRGDYKETWDFIFIGTNSLHRHCNLHLLFPEAHKK